jgi:site-specific recombinase XerC
MASRHRSSATSTQSAAEGLSAKTVQNHLNFLLGIFAFGVRRSWATANPVAMVERPRAHRSADRRIRFLQPEELEAARRAVPATSSAPSSARSISLRP